MPQKGKSMVVAAHGRYGTKSSIYVFTMCVALKRLAILEESLEVFCVLCT